VKLFARSYPNAVPIIVFRRHDSYIASQYRRFVKNGFIGGFTDFFNLENDNGRFVKQDLDYCRMLSILEKYFDKRPIVLFHQDLKTDPIEFIEKLATQINTSVDTAKLNLTNKHSSYSEQQLKAMRSLGKHINMQKRRAFKNNALNLLWRLYLGGIRYGTMFLAKLAPASWFSSEPLITKDELKKIRDAYQKDWENCLAYAKNNAITDNSQSSAVSKNG